MGAAIEPLVGRAALQAELAQRIESARDSGGSTLILRGEPGAGKTSLVQWAAARADGFTVLRCRGLESEVELPFGGLHELLLPLREEIEALAPRERNALSAALSMRGGEGTPELDVAAATLNLLARAAAAAPVLVIVDDLHWIDDATRPVLAFVARRIAHDRVLFLAASRLVDLPDRIPGDELELAPLQASEVLALLQQHGSGVQVPRETIEALTSATGGNALAVVEAARLAGDDLQRLGTVLDEPLPTGELIRRGFAAQLNDLSTTARRALVVVALGLTDSSQVATSALRALDIDQSVLDEAEAAGVIDRKLDSVAFAHPLLRAAVLHAAPPREQRAVHAALATAVPDRGSRAWHAASAATQADESVAAELADAAHAFERLGGYIAAARALERAAQLSPDPVARSERLLAAAITARMTHTERWASDLLRAAMTTAPANSRLALRIEMEQLAHNVHDASSDQQTTNALQVAARAEPVDLDIAVDALGAAVMLAMVSGRPDEARLAVGELDRLGPARDEKTQLLAASCAATQLIWSGDDPARGRELTVAIAQASLCQTIMTISQTVEVLTWVEEDELAEAVGARMLRESSDRGARRLYLPALITEAYRRWFVGDWDGGELRAEDVWEQKRDTRDVWGKVEAGWVVALVYAGKGDQRAAEIARAAETVARAHGYAYLPMYTRSALGLLALGRGDAHEAITSLGEAAAAAAACGARELNILPWPTDLIDALILAGAFSEARAELERLRERARFPERRRVNAAIARLDGTLADDGDFASHFDRALALHETIRDPFGLARTRLQFGRRLRRDGRRNKAREQLLAAVRGFEQLGAQPWLEQALGELRSAGESGQVAAASQPAATLTPQERAVASLVAKGHSNKQAAAELFLTPKTIEWHLRQIYRKLDITSRTQLALHMHAGQASSAGPTDG